MVLAVLMLTMSTSGVRIVPTAPCTYGLALMVLSTQIASEQAASVIFLPLALCHVIKREKTTLALTIVQTLLSGVAQVSLPLLNGGSV